ncbi:MAG: DNA repair protein RadA [Synechococcaceae cyanobacterium RL_1_2]|nr:DNA repair protein RadA [Synechococcaceae cyanobacterium RL_1_2]
MAKIKNLFICQECGAEHRQWFGKCTSCHLFDTLVEQINPDRSSKSTTPRAIAQVATFQKNANHDPFPIASYPLNEISDDQQVRFPSGYGEFDRVLGGGLVPGSLVLIGGDPGIGKSTLLLQTTHLLAEKLPRILYVAAEESAQQVKLRSRRLAPTIADNLYILAEINLELILQELINLKPQVAVIDSIQALYYSELGSAPGSVAQVRECTSALMQLAKRENITLLIVGHVTKEGMIAGPRVLEHLVDTVLYFEGDRYASHRLLRSVKNRFGATHEIGIFEMLAQGLTEIDNPSELFLGNREDPSSGVATVVACEGTRPLLVEIQALVSTTSYPSPRRSTTGVDYSRLQQILAVLEKRVGIPLSKLDAYVSSVGGLTVAEPAVDLGMAVALVASFRDRIIDRGTVLIGEIGLGGQVRPVSQLDLRIKEAAKLGFERVIIPKGQKVETDLGLTLIPVGKLIEAIVTALPVEQ